MSEKLYNLLFISDERVSSFYRHKTNDNSITDANRLWNSLQNVT